MHRQKRTILNRGIAVLLALLMVADLIAITSYVSYASKEENTDTYKIEAVSGSGVVGDAADSTEVPPSPTDLSLIHI